MITKTLVGLCVCVALGSLSAAAGSAAPLTTHRAAADKLTVVIPNANVNVSQPVLALEAGYFDKYGLDVTVKSGTGGNTVGLVVSGGADIGLFAPPAILSSVRQGKDMSVISGTLNVAPISVLVAKPGTTLASLRAKNGKCTLAVTTPGTANYGNAAFVNKSAGLNCTLTSYADVPTQVGALAAGRVDAAAASYDSFANAIGAQQVHILIDARKKLQRKFFSSAPFAQDVFFGMKSNLQSNRAAVVKFMRAMFDVHRLMASAPPSQLASLLAKNQDFSTQSLAILTDRWAADLPGMDPANSYISAPAWTQSLQVQTTWGVPNFDPNDASFAYPKVVDMSYYLAAEPAPRLTARAASGRAHKPIALRFVARDDGSAGITTVATVKSGNKSVFRKSKKVSSIDAKSSSIVKWTPTRSGRYRFCVYSIAPNKSASKASCATVAVR
jgi:ABC-type nitrate/sulfonate/bicarbonate transport system substrate-binding protein